MAAARLVGLYLFGSAARGDDDISSDIDVLAVYDEPPNVTLRKKILYATQASLGKRVTLAEYSSIRLTTLFEEGHLFAWHLYQESKPLQLPGIALNQHLRFKQPAPYKGGAQDAQRFIGLLSSVAREVKEDSCSLIHEAGLVYLALRNIAMSLSIELVKKADFTRASPLNISMALAMRPPCPINYYNLLIEARHASQRGLSPPDIDGCGFKKVINPALEWTYLVMERVQ